MLYCYTCVLGLHIVRDDSFLQAIEGSIQFLPADIVSKQSLQYGLSQIRMLPVSHLSVHIIICFICVYVILALHFYTKYVYIFCLDSVMCALYFIWRCSGGASHQTFV